MEAVIDVSINQQKYEVGYRDEAIAFYAPPFTKRQARVSTSG